MTETETKLKPRRFGSLHRADGIEERQPILGTWMKERDATMVFAQAGVGKSMWSMSIALAIAGGSSFLDWDSPDTETGRRVCYVDGEMDMWALHKRADLLARALGEDVDHDTLNRNFVLLARQDQGEGVAFPDLGTDEGQEVLIDFVKKESPALVVLDNLSTLATIVDENAAGSFDPVLRLIQRLQRMGCAVLLVHHTKKGGRGQNGFRGSSKLEALLNQTVELSHPRGGPVRGGTAFNMNFHKYRSLRDGSTEPRFVQLVEDGTGTRWVTEESEQSRLLALRDAVESCDFSTQGELAKHFDVSEGTMSKWKAKAIGAGLIDAESWDRCMKAAGGVEAE